MRSRSVVFAWLAVCWLPADLKTWQRAVILNIGLHDGRRGYKSNTMRSVPSLCKVFAIQSNPNFFLSVYPRWGMPS